MASVKAKKFRKVCPQCKVEFGTNRANKIYCSDKCGNKVRVSRYWENKFSAKTQETEVRP